MITVEDIKKIVEHKASLNDISEKTSKYQYPIYRHLVFYLANKDYHIAPTSIAKHFDMNHASILNGVSKFQNILDLPNQNLNKRFIELYNVCKNELAKSNYDIGLIPLIKENVNIRKRLAYLQGWLQELQKENNELKNELLQLDSILNK